MKATRILLFMSPLLWFVPPLISVNDNLGMALVDYFYKGLLRTFPGNALMAFLCYTYAGHLGREGWLWVVGSLRYPFIAPFILAFMPAKHGSAADFEQRRTAKPAVSKAVAGTFETRFPLLSAYVGSKTPVVAAEARATMEPVEANFEFSAFVDQERLNALMAGAEPRKFTVWTHPEDSGVRVFGAGLVNAPSVADVTQWLRQSAPQRKVATAVHPNEGPTKYFEYYPQAE
ncbi:MAG TPA: hypothetical protein VLY24_05100 [Bryobacteraceae bacterium]|nr:hypothetical protein [Bryobacteraceae bacterium]